MPLKVRVFTLALCVCVCAQERVQAMELWQTAAQELHRLHQAHQKTISEGQIHDGERQQLKVLVFPH